MTREKADDTSPDSGHEPGFEVAVSQLQAAVQADPTNPAVWLRLARLLAQGWRLEAAQQVLVAAKTHVDDPHVS